MFTLACNTSGTSIVLRFLFWFLCPSPSDPIILSFIKLNAAICGYNSISLQGPPSVVCGQYCCLFALYIWTRESRHLCSSGTFLLMEQISKQRRCSMRTLNLFVDHQEEASVASLLSYSKYIELIKYHCLTVCHGRFKRGVVLGIFVNDS